MMQIHLIVLRCLLLCIIMFIDMTLLTNALTNQCVIYLCIGRPRQKQRGGRNHGVGPRLRWFHRHWMWKRKIPLITCYQWRTQLQSGANVRNERFSYLHLVSTQKRSCLLLILEGLFFLKNDSKPHDNSSKSNNTKMAMDNTETDNTETDNQTIPANNIQPHHWYELL
jgi:hypothetical protein